jgi:hypothetical protein
MNLTLSCQATCISSYKEEAESIRSHLATTWPLFGFQLSDCRVAQRPSTEGILSFCPRRRGGTRTVSSTTDPRLQHWGGDYVGSDRRGLDALHWKPSSGEAVRQLKVLRNDSERIPSQVMDQRLRLSTLIRKTSTIGAAGHPPPLPGLPQRDWNRPRG